MQEILGSRTSAVPSLPTGAPRGSADEASADQPSGGATAWQPLGREAARSAPSGRGPPGRAERAEAGLGPTKDVLGFVIDFNFN